MTTIVVNERTKAGKIVLDLAKILATTNKGVTFDMEKSENVVEEKNPYNPEFVKKIKKRTSDIKSGKTKGILVNPNDIWGSLGL